jgi:hypothetical protein
MPLIASSVDSNCYTFNDDVELCASTEYNRVDRGRPQKFMKIRRKGTALSDCPEMCKEQWEVRTASTFDTCTYTIRDEGMMKGQLAQQNVM